MNGCTMRIHIDRHFAGTISPRAERAMRAHLPGCDSCRDFYHRHVLLARLVPHALPPEERLARGLGLRTDRRPAALGAGLVVAAAAAFVLLLRAHAGSDGFTSRGTGAFASPAPHVFVYDVPEGMRPTPAGDALRLGDELAFAYENASGKSRLLIFGVDEHGHVYWFHPAWTRETDDPVAIPVETDAERHELPEAIRQPFDGTRLEIRSVFVDEPVSVRRVEALLQQNPHGPLPIPGAIETSKTIAVMP
jgi:hypothetical protein